MDVSARHSALDDHFERVYRELLRIAHRSHSRVAPTLDTVAIVHEAYGRLQAGPQEWNEDGHVRAVACHAMRQIVRTYVRDRDRLKRGAGAPHVTLDGVAALEALSPEEVLDLDDALTALGTESPRQLQVVEMRYFGGYDVEEVAHALGVGTATAKRDWQKAQVFLRRRLAEYRQADPPRNSPQDRDPGAPGPAWSR